MPNITEMIFALALRAVRQYLTVEAAQRPIDRRLAMARFDGLCDAADAIGAAMTPAHFHLVVMQEIRKHEPRPFVLSVGSNDAVREWDNAVAASVVEALTA